MVKNTVNAPPRPNSEETFLVYSPFEAANGGRDSAFWSNDHGWGDIEGATRFSLEETKSLRLPITPNSDAMYVASHVAAQAVWDLKFAETLANEASENFAKACAELPGIVPITETKDSPLLSLRLALQEAWPYVDRFCTIDRIKDQVRAGFANVDVRTPTTPGVKP